MRLLLKQAIFREQKNRCYLYYCGLYMTIGNLSVSFNVEVFTEDGQGSLSGYSGESYTDAENNYYAHVGRFLESLEIVEMNQLNLENFKSAIDEVYSEELYEQL